MLPDNSELIRRGRAAVRIIKAAEVLMVTTEDRFERMTFARAQDLARETLRQLVADLDPAITAQIMVASENMIGTAGEIGPN